MNAKEMGEEGMMEGIEEMEEVVGGGKEEMVGEDS